MGKTAPRRTQHDRRYHGIDTRAAGLAGGGGEKGEGRGERRGSVELVLGTGGGGPGHAVGRDFVGKFLFFFDDGGRPAYILWAGGVISFCTLMGRTFRPASSRGWLCALALRAFTHTTS